MSPGPLDGVIASAPRLVTDVLVIGSGAGGATTAALIAEAGRDVLIAEEGPWVEQDEVRPFSLDQMDRQYRSGGVTVALGLPSIAYTEGRCAGGGTEINSGLYFRPPPAVVERWRDEYRIDDLDPDEIDSIATEVERSLSVTTVPGRVTPASARLRDGADALGWTQNEIPRWMTYPPGGDATTGVRQSMTRTYLPRAFASGARMVVGCRVDRLVSLGSRALAAEVTYADGSQGSIRCRTVFVCGGAIQTPALLQRSGIRGLVGRSLAVHPTVKLAARFGDEVNVPDDVPVHQVKEFAPDLSFGGSASHPGLVALALTDQWPTFGRAITHWRETSVYYAAITSEGRGVVRTLPGVRDPLVTYRLTRRDRELLRSGLGRLALAMLEGGAREVYPSFRGAPVVRSRADLATMQDRFAASRAGVMTVHLCSTVPLGEDRSRCAAGSFGRVHGTSNVWVNDASLLPTAPGVNPQATVMAFAIRNARRFLESKGRHG
jgi:choline dehydrogenase-like flavoprotein